MSKALWRTTITIWSDYDPAGMGLENLARDASVGESYCSQSDTVKVDDPEADPHAPSMEFFFGNYGDGPNDD